MNPAPMFGYCCNVHPGVTLDEVRQNLERYSLPIKQRVSPDRPMGIGLWLSATCAEELRIQRRRAEWGEWLANVGLVPFTLNGFPFGDFHQPVVKHSVYLPTWADETRLQYTLELARIQSQWLSENRIGTISTLPLGWPSAMGTPDSDFLVQCARNLGRCAIELDRILQETGHRIQVCIEPEPGCILDSADDLVEFYSQYLLESNPKHEALIRNHIAVCHDICHSAVMFEHQHDALARYRQAGIQVGKAQVSSAVRLSLDGLAPSEQAQRIERLKTFAEPRYLHQTVWKCGDREQLFEDLPMALAHLNSGAAAGEYRVHFHVPIFLEVANGLETTQSEIQHFLDAMKSSDQPIHHFEIETYAWNVFPGGAPTDGLVGGIAREWEWLCENFRSPP